MEDYIPVKAGFNPIIPFPKDNKQIAIKKYLKIFRNHKCKNAISLTLKVERFLLLEELLHPVHSTPYSFFVQLNKRAKFEH